MTKIFKQLARHWAACLAVAALLIVQAYCDLSLPDYTSKIVDVGIQQGGADRKPGTVYRPRYYPAGIGTADDRGRGRPGRPVVQRA